MYVFLYLFLYYIYNLFLVSTHYMYLYPYIATYPHTFLLLHCYTDICVSQCDFHCKLNTIFPPPTTTLPLRNDNFCDCSDCADEITWTCGTCGIFDEDEDQDEDRDVGAESAATGWPWGEIFRRSEE